MGYRFKGYARNRARREFNKYWEKAHPPKQNSGCLVPIVIFASGLVGAIVGGIVLLR